MAYASWNSLAYTWNSLLISWLGSIFGEESEVSDEYITHSTDLIRIPSAHIEVDWDADGVYTDETNKVRLIEGQRGVNEPLGGINIAQFDLNLNNFDERYSRGSSSPIANYLKANRRANFLLGFNGENIFVGRGISEAPRIDEKSRTAQIHFFDELENIAKHRLTTGDKLYLDVRTDWYIWDILDAVYAGTFLNIATFNSDETITGDGSAETINQRGGDSAWLLESEDGALVTASVEVDLDLSDYTDDDYITFFAFIEDASKVDTFTIRLHKVVGDAFADLNVKLVGIVDGWNHIRVKRSQFIGIDATYPLDTWFKIGVSLIEGDMVIPAGDFDWSEIVQVDVLFEATGTNDNYLIIDELRITNRNTYPPRIFDVGLQSISVAAFSGNTALFEIKSACESEGARFYADEYGVLRFENRQHYNEPEHKTSVHEFTFNRILEFSHPRSEQGIINSVNVRLKPRRIVDEKVIYTYGATTAIPAGESFEFWATFLDPVPVTPTGLVTPVATTDFTGNTQADGLGSDKTSELDIEITKFTTSAKIVITNTDADTVYLTYFQLRGTPAEESPETTIRLSDSDSIEVYGESPVGGFDISTKYLSDINYARTLGQTVIDQNKDEVDRIKITVPALPQRKIGDMITIRNNYADATFLMRILAIEFSMSNNTGLKQKITARSVSPFELLTFFEIGASTIGGTDVISN